MSTVLITGASGFVGSALVARLLDDGHEVYGLSRVRDTVRLPDRDRFTFIEGDLDADDVIDATAVGQGGVDSVIHLAWVGSTGAARLDVAVQMQNVVASSNALALASRLSAKRFIGVGTVTENEVEAVGTLVGDPSMGFIYGLAKKAACEVTRFEASRLGIEHLWARLGNIMSPGDSLEKFAVGALKKMLAGVDELNFTPGTQLMDFVSLDDAVTALTLIAFDGVPGSTYYVGEGKPLPLRSQLEAMRDAYSPSTRLNFGGVAFTGISLPADAFSIDTLTRDTGYVPRDAFLDTVAATAAWLRETGRTES